MFHHFHDQRHLPGQGSLSSAELARLIEYLGPDRILPAREWAERASRGTLTASDLCLTFDDALRCQFDIALPVLRQFGLTAFWFVYTSVMEGRLERLEVYRHFRTTRFPSVEEFYGAFRHALVRCGFGPLVAGALAGFEPSRYLPDSPFYTSGDRTFRFLRDRVLGSDRYNQVMDLMLAEDGYPLEEAARLLWMDDDCLQILQREGHVIGLHSQTHPTQIAALPVDEQEREYSANAAHLLRLLGRRPKSMSHPCNSYSQETLNVLASLGVVLGFRANVAAVEGASTLECPREDHAVIWRMVTQA